MLGYKENDYTSYRSLLFCPQTSAIKFSVNISIFYVKYIIDVIPLLTSLMYLVVREQGHTNAMAARRFCLNFF